MDAPNYRDAASSAVEYDRSIFRKVALILVLSAIQISLPPEVFCGKVDDFSAVPPQPAQRADKFGVYNWNTDDSAFLNGPGGAVDRLNLGADKVVDLGSRTIRVYLGPHDAYHIIPHNMTDLAQIAGSPAYDRLFRNASLKTYLLTVYSEADRKNSWLAGFTAEEYQAERDEIRRLGDYLLGNPAYAGKVFILLNWEGDNAVKINAGNSAAWDDYKNWIESRAEGVRDARRNRPDSLSQLYSGLEFNLVRKGEVDCGAPDADPLKNRCVIDYVAPQVTVDYYSYSSWQSVNVKFEDPNAGLKEVLKKDLGFALAKVKTRRPEVTEANFIIGEYAFTRTRFGECNAANYLSEMFDAIDGDGAFKASYVVFWQIVDDKMMGEYDIDRYGLYRVRDGLLKKTLPGEAFQRGLVYAPSISYAGCPYLRREEIGSNNIITLLGASFSQRGNRLVLEQRDPNSVINRYSIGQDRVSHESPEMIKVSLPDFLPPDPALIFVVDTLGRESNGLFVRLSERSLTVVSAASWRKTSLAPDSIAVAFGTSLATDSLGAAALPLPISLAGTSVVVKDSAGVERRAGIFYVSAAQVNFLVPPETALGGARVTIVNGNGLVSTGMAQINAVEPGLFTANADGKSAASGYALRVKRDKSQIYEPIAVYDSTEKRFECLPIEFGAEGEDLYLVLYGVGIRRRDSVSEVVVQIAGENIRALYAGPAPGYAGVDQINLPAPGSLKGRGEVDVTVIVDGKTTNTVRLCFR
jgi:uncharacterized protein (TIGR03437 family)